MKKELFSLGPATTAAVALLTSWLSSCQPEKGAAGPLWGPVPSCPSARQSMERPLCLDPLWLERLNNQPPGQWALAGGGGGAGVKTGHGTCRLDKCQLHL